MASILHENRAIEVCLVINWGGSAYFHEPDIPEKMLIFLFELEMSLLVAMLLDLESGN